MMGAELVVVCGSSEVGKEAASTAAILPHELTLIVSPTFDSEEHLVKVAIQPVSIGQKVVQKRRKIVARKVKNANPNVPDDMVIEVSNVSADIPDSKKVYIKEAWGIVLKIILIL
ncbi:phenylalanine--tRNA ligase beta subunit [Striga asiatica]|uniref:Phenylalanine--tRNA ligase beta subunit n=1 Tax=Striga asiatica TaxID=4170 RepID=A0A5A7PE89_STRAF|nr:phenylalanine--tRNA ligase beta subunit [Striga asiatica]